MGNAKLVLSRRRVVIGLLAVALLVVALFVWQAVTASRALLDSRERAETVQTRIQAGDFDGASRALGDLQKSTRTAHARTGGLLWDIGRRIPYVGRNIGAVQTVSAVLDTATRINAPIALQLSQAVSDGRFRPAAGTIDLSEVVRLTPDVRRAADSIAKAGTDLDAIRPGRLTFPFNDLVGDLQDQVARARSAAGGAADAFELLPQMLGRDGARDYLLMIQNPAELRSTGGLPGSLAILHADGGKVSMTWQGSATDLKGFSGPVVKLAKDTLAQYGPTPATDFRDINFSPDFPEAAQVARAMVKQKLGTTVDGVISVDPIALGALLQGIGPVRLTSGVVLTGANIAATLLNDTYVRIQDPTRQDDFFEDSARKVFDAVMAGQGNQQVAIRGLAAGASQHRVLLWSADAQEQARFAGTAIGGELTSDTGGTPHIGMYLNDSTAGKMDYYLHYRTSATPVDCRKGGSQDLRATMVLTSTMPKNFSRLGPYVLGNGDFAKPGTIAFNLRVYAPYGGQITGMKVDGEPVSVTADKDHGRQVGFLPFSLAPGQQSTVTADIRTAAGQDADGVFDYTPGILPAPNGVRINSACG
ncbi:MAG: hypothetical protein JWQ74_957 [Marmoricola sp.]|nr:hypothetical protein [Marmoricola sp.]